MQPKDKRAATKKGESSASRGGAPSGASASGMARSMTKRASPVDCGTEGSVKVLGKAMRVLEALANSTRPLTVLEMAQYAGENRSTTHRLVKTLVQLGYVEPDPVSSTHFNMGPETLPLASRYLNARPLRSAALPLLYALAAETGNKAHLATEVRGRIMYLGGFDDPSLPSLYAHFGQTAPMHCTSVGKSILAFLPPAETEERLKTLKLEPYTSRTITDVAVLRRELNKTRERGFAEDTGEHREGVRCIGVPILGADYRPLGGISLVARDLNKLEPTIDRLKRTGNLISQAVSLTVVY
jgi:IclR family acetate operon transcriptional repressor